MEDLSATLKRWDELAGDIKQGGNTELGGADDPPTDVLVVSAAVDFWLTMDLAKIGGDPVREDAVRVDPVRVDPLRVDPVRVDPVREGLDKFSVLANRLAVNRLTGDEPVTGKGLEADKAGSVVRMVPWTGSDDLEGSHFWGFSEK
ncbi:hypothetical protein GNI_026570 [Gregarina niphandrodes]|uniref:Uncharacterized protein n=1 Tax=Gregarina niphandrodes TaxID=110365 RepID=A0A023BBB6_GRENI|nr:hypothetical protein GNI_026570 [Gregarina niphandrodes]EZG79406.1 hypothetical protein GNI_026570 [Gregarina niphandrodes]|eukprot:XP_011129053.1 hypothetical protein GNI_026570 [Gregarina niphandrodes]